MNFLSVARLSIFTWKTCKAKLTWCLRRWDKKICRVPMDSRGVLDLIDWCNCGVMNSKNYELEVDETWWNLDSCVHGRSYTWSGLHWTSNFKGLTESFKILQVHSRRTLKGFCELDKTCSASSWLPLSFVEPMLLTKESGQDNEWTWFLYSLHFQNKMWKF